MRVLFAALGLFLTTCTIEVVDPSAGTPDAAMEPDAAKSDAARKDNDVVTEEELRLLAEQDEIKRKLEAGEPITPDEVVSDLSAYQRGAIQREATQKRVPTWLLLARQAFSESANDIEALLQMDLNLAEKWKVSLPAAIKRRAPKATGTEATTRGRQKLSSTLPGWGNEPGELWEECDSWVKHPKTGRWQGLPEGCHGSWKNTLPKWKKIRARAKAIYKTRPTVIKGHVLDQGGLMDLADYLAGNPHMCLLDSPGSDNFFFGRRNDPRNTCITPTAEQLAKSRKVARLIDRRDKKLGEGRYAKVKTISAAEASGGFSKRPRRPNTQ